jgi:hypothetical protein
MVVTLDEVGLGSATLGKEKLRCLGSIWLGWVSFIQTGSGWVSVRSINVVTDYKATPGVGFQRRVAWSPQPQPRCNRSAVSATQRSASSLQGLVL